jgi:hypothetical protein
MSTTPTAPTPKNNYRADEKAWLPAAYDRLGRVHDAAQRTRHAPTSVLPLEGRGWNEPLAALQRLLEAALAVLALF